MGLDNGIILKTKDTPSKKYTLRYTQPDPDYKEYEVCYWRKCWGIRTAILEVLDPQGLSRNNSHFPIDTEDIPALIRALMPFFDKNYWDENAQSIWEFEDMFETLVTHVVNLEYLKDYMEENKDAEVYFYDSY